MEGSAVGIRSFFVFLHQLSLLLRARASHVRDQIIHSCQEEAEEEKAEEQFWLTVQEEEEKQRKNDCDNRIVLSERENTPHESCKVHEAP